MLCFAVKTEERFSIVPSKGFQMRGISGMGELRKFRKKLCNERRRCRTFWCGRDRKMRKSEAGVIKVVSNETVKKDLARRSSM